MIVIVHSDESAVKLAGTCYHYPAARISPGCAQPPCPVAEIEIHLTVEQHLEFAKRVHMV